MTTLFNLGSVGEGLPHAENTGLVISDVAKIRTFPFPASVFQIFSMKMLRIHLMVSHPVGCSVFVPFPLMEKEPKRSMPKISAHRTAVLSGESQGGECLRSEGKRFPLRYARGSRPALSLCPLSPSFWRALLRFLAFPPRPAQQSESCLLD